VDYPGWNAPWSAPHHVAFAIRPKLKDYEDRHGAKLFWDEVLGKEATDRIEDSDFLRGFGEGVAEVWDEVSDEL
jgi:hypothetical protein